MQGAAKESSARSQFLTWTKWEWKFLSLTVVKFLTCAHLLRTLSQIVHRLMLKKPTSSKMVWPFFFFFFFHPSMPRLWINTGFVWEDEAFPVSFDADRTVWKWYQHFEDFFFFFTFKRKFINDVVNLNKSNVSFLELISSQIFKKTFF